MAPVQADRHLRWRLHRGSVASRMGPAPAIAVKEISLLEVLGRFAARFAAVSGVIALVIWVTWVMLDVKNLQSGFTLP